MFSMFAQDSLNNLHHPTFLENQLHGHHYGCLILLPQSYAVGSVLSWTTTPQAERSRRGFWKMCFCMTLSIKSCRPLMS